MKECELQQNKMETEQIFWRLNLPLEGHIPRSKMPQFVFNFPRRFYCQFKFAQCVETLLIFRLGPPPGLPRRPGTPEEKDQEI